MPNPNPQDKAGVRFTIPDKPPEEQLRMARNIREMMMTFSKVTGEEDELDLTSVDEAIAKLETQVKEQKK